MARLGCRKRGYGVGAGLFSILNSPDHGIDTIVVILPLTVKYQQYIAASKREPKRAFHRSATRYILLYMNASSQPVREIDVPSAPTGPARDRILRVAKTLFAKRGYEHASTSSIARQAGTSESQLMKHFGSKAGLLEAIFLEGWKTITEQARLAIQDLPTPLEKVQVIAGTALMALERDPEMKQLLLLEARRVRKEGQMVAISEGFLVFVQLIDGVLNEAQAMNLLRPSLSPQAVRSALIGMLEGMLRDRFLAEHLNFPADYDLREMDETLTLALSSFTVSQPTSS